MEARFKGRYTAVFLWRRRDAQELCRHRNLIPECYL